MARNEIDLDALLHVPELFGQGGSSLGDLFVDAGVLSTDDDTLTAMVHDRLADEPRFIESWQEYSYDKRSTPSPYLDGLEVGHYDAGRRNVRTHSTVVSACADFVLREVRWVTEHRVVE